jgi:hypothetical protein
MEERIWTSLIARATLWGLEDADLSAVERFAAAHRSPSSFEESIRRPEDLILLYS